MSDMTIVAPDIARQVGTHLELRDAIAAGLTHLTMQLSRGDWIDLGRVDATSSGAVWVAGSAVERGTRVIAYNDVRLKEVGATLAAVVRRVGRRASSDA